jgi:tetratricopeptide (TPR) repeat protein
MSRSGRVTAVASLLLVMSMAASVFMLQRVDEARPAATLTEVLYLPSPRVLKRLSLGYDGLLADIYWTRAVQYFGARHYAGAAHYDLLAPLLEITTALDPHLVVAYEFGSNFLSPKPPNGAGMPQRAIALAEFGIRNNPDEWRLYYDLGFIYYTDLKDYAKAADAFARGSRVPKAHPFLKLLAAQMAEHAGEIETARTLWTTTFETTEDGNIRANAVAHLRALKVDEEVASLEKIVAAYEQKTGHHPVSFADMAHAGLLPGIPLDPLGVPYVLGAEGRVEVQDPDNLPFIEKGLPLGYVPPKKPKFLPSD